MPTLDFAQMPTPDVSFDRYRDSDLSDVMYPFYVFGIMFAGLLILMHWTTIWNTLFMILDFWTNDDVFSYRIKIWVIVFVLYAGLYIFCEPFRIILDFYMWIICCVMKAAYKSIRSAVLGFIWVVEERQRIFASIKRMMHTIRSKFPSRIVPNDPKNDAEPAAPCNSNHTSAKYVSQPDTAPPQLILDRGEDELLDLITDQLNFRKKDVKTEFNRLVSEIEASLAKRGELTDKEKFKIYQNEMPRETSRFDSTDYSKLVCVVEKHLLKKKLLNSRIRILMLLKWTSDNTSDLVIAYLVNLFEGDDGLYQGIRDHGLRILREKVLDNQHSGTLQDNLTEDTSGQVCFPFASHQARFERFVQDRHRVVQSGVKIGAPKQIKRVCNSCFISPTISIRRCSALHTTAIRTRTLRGKCTCGSVPSAWRGRKWPFLRYESLCFSLSSQKLTKCATGHRRGLEQRSAPNSSAGV